MTGFALISDSSQLRVSSVLNKDSKLYGKQYLVDDSLETCWNSAPVGEQQRQWIDIALNEQHLSNHTTELQIMFQGGFGSSRIDVMGLPVDMNDSKKWIPISTVYPDNSNALQMFDIGAVSANSRLRLMFRDFHDEFSRLIVYKLQMYIKPL